MRDVVRFTLNGAAAEVRAPDPTLTLLDWLRNERRLTGTKEGCAEGDCGACTIMAVDPAGAVRAINTCITFLPMVDGCTLTTVEGLGGADPVQTAIVAEHGSQCGFCTPGIVMSLYAHRARGGASDTTAITDCLAGNLCRCTGYGPIVRAGQQACAALAPDLPARPAPAEPLGYDTGEGRRFLAPTSLDALLDLYAAHLDATILAGATDVGLWVTKQQRRLETLISVMRVSELQAIEDTGASIRIGAAVRYADAFDSLATLHPSFTAYLKRLGAAQVRDSGTVVGNIANGSPIGDMPPVLIALDARIELRKAGATRQFPLADYFLAYGKQDRTPGEIVSHVIIPKPAPGAFFAAEKISKRFEQDISAVSAGLFVQVKTGVVAQARLAFGGMAGIPKRADAAEAALMGQPWTEASITAAMSALAQDFAPLTDWRASAAYRLDAARGLLLRFFHETTAPSPRVTELGSVAHG